MTQVYFSTRTKFSKAALPTLADVARITDQVISDLFNQGFDHSQIKTICELVKVDLDARAIEFNWQQQQLPPNVKEPGVTFYERTK